MGCAGLGRAPEARSGHVTCGVAGNFGFARRMRSD